MSGVVVLAGGGEFQPAMTYVDRVVLDNVRGEARVAIVPAAAGRDADSARRHADAGAAYFRELGVEADAVPIVDRESAMDEALADRIRAANLVYLADGDAGYLYRTLRRTHAWVAIGDVTEAGGVVAGSGAGAVIFGERIIGSPAPFWPWPRVFNIFPGAVIVPDYVNRSGFGLRMRRLSRRRRFTYLGIDRHTALLNENFQFTVVGEGDVTVWSRLRHEKREDGDPLVWP